MKALSVKADLTFWDLQSLYLAVQKNKMRKVDCMSHRYIWTSLVSKYACVIQAELQEWPQGCGPQVWAQAAGRSWQDVGAHAALCPGSSLPNSQRHCAVCFSAHMCLALPTFSRLFFLLHASSPFFPHLSCFEAFLPLPGCSSLHFSFSSFHFFQRESN